MAIDRAYSDQLRAGVTEQLPKVVPAADSSRVDGLDAAINVGTAHYMALSIGRGRAAAKYGAGSAQVKALDARLNAAAATAVAVRTAREQALVEAPVLPPNSAGVFGRVVGADGAGIAGAVVEALDAKLAPIKHATTQDGGAYQLVLTIGQSGRIGEHEHEHDEHEHDESDFAARDVSASEIATAAAPASTAPPPTLSVTLRATAAGQETLRSTEVLTLHVGDTVLRQLTLTARPAPPPPPPPTKA
jgi:hypothetical protein